MNDDPDSDAVDRLERWLDGRAVKLAGGVIQALRRARGGWRTSRASAGQQLAESVEKDLDPAALIAATRWALREGACETAQLLGERLLLALPTLPHPAATESAVVAIAALLMTGERERAAILARQHAHGLAQTPEGATQLELLGLTSSSFWLPDGRPNFVGLSRQLAAAALRAEDIARALRKEPWQLLRSPELHLLLFNALQREDTQRACRFMSRYLALHGLPACDPRGANEAGHPLERLAFRASSKIHGGPLVSILMAARNATLTLRYAIDSLLAQTYQNIEILVGDDASDDDSVPLLRRRYGHEPRVRLFRSMRQQGAYNLRNALSRQARGELLAFHDADDLALPARIALQVRQLERPGVVASVGNWLRVDDHGSVVFFSNQKASRLSLVSLLLTRSAFDSVGPFHPARVGADLDLHSELRVRFGPAGIARLGAPLIFGAWSVGSATRTAGDEALEDGYRSPTRRAYSEACFRQRAPGYRRRSDAEMVEMLRVIGNCLEPSELGRF